jgi:hypothetical protein
MEPFFCIALPLGEHLEPRHELAVWTESVFFLQGPESVAVVAAGGTVDRSLPIEFGAGSAGLGSCYLDSFPGRAIFDGKSAALSAPSNVLISGNIIERVSASPITIDAKANVQVIPGNDRRALARDVGADDAGTGVR